MSSHILGKCSPAELYPWHCSLFTAFVYACVYSVQYVWEWGIMPSSTILHFIFKMEFLTKLEFLKFVLNGWLSSSRNTAVSSCPVLGLQIHRPAWLLSNCCGCELWYSCLHGDQLTEWVIHKSSPMPLFVGGGCFETGSHADKVLKSRSSCLDSQLLWNIYYVAHLFLFLFWIPLFHSSS